MHLTWSQTLVEDELVGVEKVVVASKLVIHKPFFKGDGHDVSFANLPFPHSLPSFRASSPIYHSIQSRKSSVLVCLGS